MEKNFSKNKKSAVLKQAVMKSLKKEEMSNVGVFAWSGKENCKGSN